MSNKLNPITDPSEPMVYQIKLKGHLGRQWTHWFGSLTITMEDLEFQPPFNIKEKKSQKG